MKPIEVSVWLCVLLLKMLYVSEYYSMTLTWGHEPIMVHNEDLWLSFESVKSHVDHRNYKHIDVRNGYIVESR